MFARTLRVIAPRLENTRSFAVTGRHSKNVAGKKNKLDAQKTKLFAKLGTRIVMAAKAGGSDPTSNPELAKALRDAHSVKLPRDNIERALNTAKDKSSANFEVGVYEFFGVGGVGFVVNTLTDNSNRALFELKNALKKTAAKQASGGSVLFNFEQKAIFSPQPGKFDKDLIFEKAIEKEIDDINFVPLINGLNLEDESGNLEFIVSNVEEMGKLQEITDELKLLGRTTLGYLPKDLVDVTEEQFEQNMEIIDILEGVDDVETVFHNMNTAE